MLNRLRPPRTTDLKRNRPEETLSKRSRPTETRVKRERAQILPEPVLDLPAVPPNLQLIPARIDVPEELFLNSGEVGTWSFFYHPGRPFAHAFGLVWYPTREDRSRRMNPLMLLLPRLTFYPATPLQRLPTEDEFEHEGYFEVRAPVVATDTIFFGEAIIFQEEYNEPT